MLANVQYAGRHRYLFRVKPAQEELLILSRVRKVLPIKRSSYFFLRHAIRPSFRSEYASFTPLTGEGMPQSQLILWAFVICALCGVKASLWPLVNFFSLCWSPPVPLCNPTVVRTTFLSRRLRDANILFIF